MKLTRNLALATAGALLLFTGCQDQDVPTLQNGEVALQLSSSVDGLRVTSDNKWESGDAIGVFAPALTASNVQYTTTSTEATADFTATAPIKIPEGTTEYDIQAYYPYKDGVTDSYAITLPVAKPILYATGKASHAEPKITVAFKHQLAQIQLKISGDGIELTEAGSVELKEVATTGTLTIADGTVTAGTTKGKLALTSSTFDATNKSFAATAFLIPSENLEEKEFTVTVGDKTYTGKLPAGTATDATTKSIVAGKRYVYTVGLKPAAVATAELKLSQSTIQGPTEETIDTIVGLEPDATPTTPGEPTPTPGEPATGTSELFPGDLNQYITFDKVTGSIDATAGKDGKPAIVVSHNSTNNAHNWRATVPALSGRPKTMSFYIKGSGTKDLVVRFCKPDKSFPDNSGFKVSEGISGKTLTSGGFKYGASFSVEDWTKITLDLTSLELQTNEGELFFEVRHGKGGVFDYSVSSFEVTY